MATVDSDHWLWRPADLSLMGAFKWKIPQPHVGDPASLPRFLAHYLSEQEQGVVLDVSLERTMLALAGALAEVVGEGVAKVDFTQPLLFNEICYALRNGAPYLLRHATVIFLRHLDAQFFNRNKTFSVDQVNAFVSGWSSIIFRAGIVGDGAWPILGRSSIWDADGHARFTLLAGAHTT